ncbi:hypothetical protein BIU82_14110 [Arthrobacter sp. SW1]|uniref:hypothetical protein n=1 Tax=Arthrobacter sp. SW1 TaxID=1920889 RepID=UPI000877B361|nr:hypothetical protein [Arthrobacter sp. SW1]OFI39457.1 hypothetical protein BIU82_14110 [Arthrobacter sp. SW1]
MNASPKNVRRRRRLAWAALPAVVVLAASAKMLSLGPLGTAAADAFDGKDAGALETAAAWLGAVNLIEPWKADFATGDAHVLRGDFAAARASFEAALRSAPENDGCRIRVNLVLGIERLGDGQRSAGDDAGAKALYAEGLEVVRGAPAGCFDAGGAGNAAGEGRRLSDARERLAAKSGDAGGEGGDGGDAPEENATEQEQLKRLEESQRQARQERLKSEQRSEYLRNPETNSTVERPW